MLLWYRIVNLFMTGSLLRNYFRNHSTLLKLKILWFEKRKDITFENHWDEFCRFPLKFLPKDPFQSSLISSFSSLSFLFIYIILFTCAALRCPSFFINLRLFPCIVFSSFPPFLFLFSFLARSLILSLTLFSFIFKLKCPALPLSARKFAPR